jgi:hypothetical protein
MRKINLLATSIALALTTQIAVAADYSYLFNPSTMTVGSTLSEYLTVKEACPNDKTDCQASEKLRYVTTQAGRTGRLELSVNSDKDFEISFNIQSHGCGTNLTFTLYMSDNTTKIVSLGACGLEAYFQGKEVGFANWIDDAINDFRFIVSNGNIKIGGNDSFPREFPLDSSGTVTRIVISQIIEKYRFFEIRTRGISNIASCPTGSPTTTTPISGTTNMGDLPQIASNLDIKIPRGLYSQSNIFTPSPQIPVWANLKYNAQSNSWTLSGAGVLPQ